MEVRGELGDPWEKVGRWAGGWREKDGGGEGVWKEWDGNGRDTCDERVGEDVEQVAMVSVAYLT